MSAEQGEGTPLPNRGVPKPSIRAGLDWLRFSVTETRTAITTYQRVFEGGASGALGEEKTPYPHYDAAFSLDPGRLDMSKSATQGGLFTFTGSALEQWREKGRSERELLAFALLNAKNITRLDFALDVYTPGADPRHVWEEWRGGRANCRARTGTEMKSHADGAEGYTCYIGSRTSARLLRVYDKAAQQRVKGVAWTRIELESKAPMAATLAQAMLETSILDAGRAAVRGFFDAPALAWWQDAMTGPKVANLTPGKRKETSFERWLYETVFPALEKSLRRGDAGLLEKLRELVDLGERMVQ